MKIIQRAKDYFYILRKGRKTKEVDQVRHLWTERGGDYYELQEKMLAEKGNSYFAQDELFNFIAKGEFYTILELGSGYGWNIKRLFKEYPGKNIVGIDFSRPQLLKSRVYPEIWDSNRVIILEGDITNMGLADKCIDISFSLGILMNIPPSNILKGLKEIIRVTRKRIILFEYFIPYCENKEFIKAAKKHPYIFSHDYEKMMKKLGCKLICLDENRGTPSDRYTFYEFSMPIEHFESPLPPEFNRLKIIACTKCKGTLIETKKGLVCESCGLLYAVEDNLPDMVLSKAKSIVV